MPPRRPERDATEVKQLECPIERYRTAAQTQDGAAARLIEHFIDRHPGGLPETVIKPVKEILARYK